MCTQLRLSGLSESQQIDRTGLGPQSMPATSNVVEQDDAGIGYA